MTVALIISAALLLDALLGEPRHWHPLVGFGRLADRVESTLNRRQGSSRLRGALALLLLVAPPVLLAALLEQATPLIGILLLYLALGGRSLVEHAGRVRRALSADDLGSARQRVGEIVSRDTAQMQRPDVAKAVIESLLENGSDALFGALFWFLLAGAPGVVAYRLVNTLDAMWGYRTSRFAAFGWAAARLDDLLNLIPARLTALSYAVTGAFRQALRCWHAQAGNWESPNAGPVMAAGAGALNIRLGGAARYHGELRQRPSLGSGREPVSEDIGRAIQLLIRSTLLWAVVILAGGWALA